MRQRVEPLMKFVRPFKVRPSGAIVHICTHLSYLPEESSQRELDRKRLSALEGEGVVIPSIVTDLAYFQR